MRNLLYDFAFYCAISVCIFIVIISLIQVFIYLWQLIVAAYVLVNNPDRDRRLLSTNNNDGLLHPITIIMPAYNESLTIIDSIQSMLASDYPNVDMIVVNDGSTDDTLDVIRENFDIAPIEHDLEGEHNVLAHAKIRGVYVSLKDKRLRIIDKENGGKADAHNAAINLSRAPILCLLDADSILETDALSRVAVPFLDDPRTIAVGGSIRVANSCIIQGGIVKKARLSRLRIVRLQALEYMRSFLMSKISWGHIRTLPMISGAFGVFRRDIVLKVGGFTKGSMGEDFDFTIKLHKYIYDSGIDYRIKFIPEATCWTQVPEKWKVLQNQRIRWQAGAIQTLIHFKSLALQFKYKRISLLLMPYCILVDVLGPLSELLGYVLMPLFWYFEITTAHIIISYCLLVFCYNILISSAAIAIDGTLLRGFDKKRYLISLFAIAIFENFGYRQLNTYWKIRSNWRLITGQVTWGKMERVKFEKHDDQQTN